MNEFLEKKIDFYDKYASEVKVNEKPPTALLDELFKETIFEVWKQIMKSGVCPKCKSEEVYMDGRSNHGIHIPIGLMGNHPTRIYVCADCEYVEIYAHPEYGFSKVKEKFKKVKK